jgi:hypothetical protein
VRPGDGRREGEGGEGREKERGKRGEAYLEMKITYNHNLYE